MSSPKKIFEIQKELNNWRSLHIDALNHTQIISTPFEYGPKPWEPTERQKTLGRLLGRPPEDFIP